MEFWSLHFPCISQLGLGHSNMIKGCTLCQNEYHTATVCPIRAQMFIPDSVELIPRSPSRRKSFSRRRGSIQEPPDRTTSYKSTKSTSRQSKTHTSAPNICDFFNMPRGCKKRNCNYSHRCARCKASSHGTYSCPN
jgi:hypothetical protein